MTTPIDPKVEIELDGVWTDITSYVRYDGRISISRGRGDEDSDLPPSTASFKLNNSDGRFSPRNPLSPYYGVLGRNTPVRISLPYGETYLRVRDLRQAYTTAAQSRVSCPDASALGITGDIDVRIDLTPLSWRTGSCNLASKYLITGDQRSWFMYMLDGYVGFGWSPDGTLASRITTQSTEPVPATSGRRALRATLDVNNGSGGYTVTFYTADTISGSWTQLGDPVTGSGTTSVYDSTASVEIGDIVGITGEGVDGYYHAFELRSGIGGTVVADPDFSIQTPGATTFHDSASTPNTWTVDTEAYLSDRIYRFTGEISSWPQQWDPSGRDVWVNVQASGITRRLQQGADPLQSALRRQLSTASTDIVAYWPMEDQGADVFSSAVEGGRPLVLRSGTASDPASFSDFVGSAPLPSFSTGVYRASVPDYFLTEGETQLRFLLAVPSNGLTATSLLAQLTCTGSARRWDVWWSVGDNKIHTTTYDADGAQLATQTTSLDPRGKLLRMSLELTQNGSDIDYKVVWLEQGESTGFSNSYTLTGNTVGRVYVVSIGGEYGQDLDGTAIGHVSLSNQITSIHDAAPQFNAYGAYGDGQYLGEDPTTRMVRLSEENDAGQMDVTSFGLTDDGTTMGAQGVKTYLGLLRECVATDLGLLYEPRDRLGLGYRSRLALYNQSPRLSLSYSGHELADSLDPVDDDQKVRNDITVTRDKGSNYRAVLESGALSVNAPPDGVGRYTEAVTLVLGTDEQLPDQAGWRLHTGTVDEARYPSIKLNLRHATFDNDAAMRQAALLTDLGDRVLISDVPAWLPPDDISLLVQGYSEVFDSFEHEITFNCSPESPWHVAVVGRDGFDRLGTEGSTLATAVTSTATSLSVGPEAQSVSYTSGSGTWVAPAGVTSAGVECWGGGGGGGASSSAGFSGGGGGEYAAEVVSVTPGNSYAYSVGAGGAGANGPPSDFTGDDGGNSTFESTTVVAHGGAGGFGAGGGAGGTGSSNTTHYNGGGGGDGYEDLTVSTSGGGGGSGGTASAGNDGADGTISGDGAGGAAVTGGGAGGTGFNATGSSPGGGGGGAGDGANGMVRITYTTDQGLWTTDTDDLPFDITVGGERMTVTAVSGTTLPQTFTVTRSVNGVVKAHSAGASLALAEPLYIAL